MKPDKIIIHHSLTKDSCTMSWSSIRRYHKEELGWSDIGYHFGIESINCNAEILFGRSPLLKGAHCRGYNKNSISVCVVGNFDTFPPPAGKWEKLKELLNWLLLIYNIPVSEIYGHNHFSTKSCPGNKFDIQKLKNELMHVC